MKEVEIKNIQLYDKFKDEIDDTIIISNMNFKGGSAKTATTAIQAYELSRHGFKVLAIDNDPQANLTEFLLQDKEFDNDISDLILQSEDIENCIVNVNDYLDIIPSSLNYVFVDDLERSKNSIYNILNSKINKVKNEYDFIFIDVPPSININLKLAIHSCTHINLVVQTKMSSFYGSQKLIQWLESYLDKNNIDIHLIGVIPTLTVPRKHKHKDVIDIIYNYYEDISYKNLVDYSDRVDHFNDYGIDENDYWSKVTLNKFNKLNDEMLSKIVE